MQFNTATAPYFRDCEPTRRIVIDRLAAAGITALASVFVYGVRALIMVGTGILGAVLTELLWQRIARRESTINDLSALLSGVICACLLPANAPVWLPAIAAAFAVGVVKLPFGGFGRSPFCTEAAGYCFAALLSANLADIYNRAMLDAAERDVFDLLPERYFGYVRGILPVFGNTQYTDRISEALSPPMAVRGGLDPELSAVDILFSGAKGPLGTTMIFLLVLCMVWLVLRRAVAWQTTAAYIAVMIPLSLIFRIKSVPVYMSPVYDILTGSTLFCAVFLAGDIFTAPHFGSARAIYGVGCGILTIILRRIGSVEGGEIFALLMMNAVASPLDRMVWICRRRGISFSILHERVSAVLRKHFKPKNRFDIDVDELYAELEANKKNPNRGDGDHGA